MAKKTAGAKVKRVAEGIVSGLTKIQNNPDTAKEAWATGVCNFVLSKGKISKDEYEPCIQNLTGNEGISNPVPRVIPTAESVATKLAEKGITDDSYRQFGQKGGAFMKKYGADIVAEKQAALARGGMTKKQRKAQVWGA